MTTYSMEVGVVSAYVLYIYIYLYTIYTYIYMLYVFFWGDTMITDLR